MAALPLDEVERRLNSPEYIRYLCPEVFEPAIFAYAMGIIGCESDPNGDEPGTQKGFPSSDDSDDEIDPFTKKQSFTRTIAKRIGLEPPAAQAIYWAQFCVVYLPTTVDSLLAATIGTRLSPEFIAISHAHESPYFMKYLRSQSPLATGGKQLPAYLAQVILELFEPSLGTGENARWAVLAADEVLEVLSTLLNVFAKRIREESLIPAPIRTRLVRVLWHWDRNDVVSGHFAAWCAVQVAGDPVAVQISTEQRRRLGRWVDALCPPATFPRISGSVIDARQLATYVPV